MCRRLQERLVESHVEQKSVFWSGIVWSRGHHVVQILVRKDNLYLHAIDSRRKCIAKFSSIVSH